MGCIQPFIQDGQDLIPAMPQNQGDVIQIRFQGGIHHAVDDIRIADFQELLGSAESVRHAGRQNDTGYGTCVGHGLAAFLLIMGAGSAGFR